MRNILAIALLVAAALPLAAQQGPNTLPNAPSWTRVEALPAGQAIHVHAAGLSSTCKIKVADESSLTCGSGDGAKTEVFQKADVRKITTPHRGRSTLIGAGIGVGAGAILGASSSGGSPGQFFYISRPEGALILAVPFGLIGALVGALTDFTRATVYNGH